jgi:hypothetical protein
LQNSNEADSRFNQSRCPFNLTTKVIREFTYAIAQGSFGDVWKCRLSEKDNIAEVGISFKAGLSHRRSWLEKVGRLLLSWISRPSVMIATTGGSEIDPNN